MMMPEQMRASKTRNGAVFWGFFGADEDRYETITSRTSMRRPACQKEASWPISGCSSRAASELMKIIAEMQRETMMVGLIFISVSSEFASDACSGIIGDQAQDGDHNQQGKSNCEEDMIMH